MALGIAVLTVISPALAQEPKDRAQALFDEARRLMREDKHAEACPKLKESQRLDPGMGTQFRLAECYEAIGKLEAAQSAFREVADAARQAGQAKREAVARERAAAIEAKLAKLKQTSQKPEGPTSAQSGAAPPRNPWVGRLAVRSIGPGAGQVYIDNLLRGSTPLVAPVKRGAHSIRVEYPGGHEVSRTVFVDGGEVVEAAFERPPLDIWSAYRRGLHFGFGSGPAFSLFLEERTPFGAGHTAELVMNVGIAPAVDFRTGLSASMFYHYHYDYTESYSADGYYNGAWSGSVRFPLMITLPFRLRFNLGSRYAFMLGASVGFSIGDAASFTGGPEWSFLSLRFGDRREFEVELTQGVHLAHPDEQLTNWRHSLMFTYLFLPDAE
jgi:hypothetical protein